MLRALVVSLALANLGFWAWTQGALDGVTGVPHDGDREPQRLAAQIDPGRLEIIAPPPSAPVRTPPPVKAEAAATLNLPDPAATVASAPLAAASAGARPAPAAHVCVEAGPFNAAEWRTAQTALRRVLDESSWTLTSREKAGTWMVYVGPYKSRDIMTRRADQLRQLEIAFEEARDLPDEYMPGFVFGRYGVEADARALQTRLTAQKIRFVRVVALVKPSVTHTVRVPKADPDVLVALTALKPRLSGHAFEPCGR